MGRKLPLEKRFTTASWDQVKNSSKLVSREAVTDDNPWSVGDFVSRLWRRFGPPVVTYEGFHYDLFDRQSKLFFTAYSAGSGPSYGGGQNKRKLLADETLPALERLLAKTTPADCDMLYDTDYGPVRSGAKNGIPFDVSLMEVEEHDSLLSRTDGEVSTVLLLSTCLSFRELLSKAEAAENRIGRLTAKKSAGRKARKQAAEKTAARKRTSNKAPAKKRQPTT
jgi:hypothetical protein